MVDAGKNFWLGLDMRWDLRALFFQSLNDTALSIRILINTKKKKRNTLLSRLVKEGIESRSGEMYQQREWVWVCYMSFMVTLWAKGLLEPNFVNPIKFSANQEHSQIQTRIQCCESCSNHGMYNHILININIHSVVLLEPTLRVNVVIIHMYERVCQYLLAIWLVLSLGPVH